VTHALDTRIHPFPCLVRPLALRVDIPDTMMFARFVAVHIGLIAAHAARSRIEDDTGVLLSGPHTGCTGNCTFKHPPVATVPFSSGVLEIRADPLKVNHMTTRQETDPIQDAIGVATSVLLIGLVVFMCIIVYLVNFPDPQVRIYGNKLVSVGATIYMGALMEKVLMFYVKTKVALPLFGMRGYDGAVKAIAMEFALALIIFWCWFAAISWCSFKARHSPYNLFAVKGLVGHCCAFMGLHAFGYFEKHLVKKFESLLGVAICYVLFPFVTMAFISFGSYVARWVRSKWLDARHQIAQVLGVPTAVALGAGTNPHSDGAEELANQCPKDAQTRAETTVAMVERRDHAHFPHHGHEHEAAWLETAEEAESDVSAIVSSFLLRQAVLFLSTGRLPSTKGDYGPHGTEEWTVLGVACASLIAVLVVCTVVKARLGWHGGEGELIPRMHFSQLFVAMSLGWCLLCAVHWLMQRTVSHLAMWNAATALSVSPLSILVIAVVDKLADWRWLSVSSENVILNGAGVMLGFAWETAFASCIDIAVNKAMNFSTIIESALCLGLIVIVFPAWRYFIVPRACGKAPERFFSE